MLDNLSKKIGFTQTEIKVILFLAFFFVVGLGYKIYLQKDAPNYRNFNYSRQDSIFEKYVAEEKNKLKEEKSIISVDSNSEVLNFSPGNSKKKQFNTLPGEKSININTADVKTLIKIPGIGPKTAKKIVILRTQRSGFKTLKELKDVKGIGESKFNKIKKFLYIEQSF